MDQEIPRGYYAVFQTAGVPMTLESRPLPLPDSNEILVRIEYTTLCRSDLHTYNGKRKEKSPTVLGHEIVGRISAMGDEVPKKDLRGDFLRLGDRISWAIFSSNPESPISLSGFPQKADNLFKYGHELLSEGNCFHGGLGSHILLRPHTPVIKINESISLPTAAIVNCAVATISGAIRLAEDLKDKVVIISGAGMLGLIACAMCNIAGAKEIIAVDLLDSRLEMARKFGATHVAKPSKMELFGRKADRVIELSGAASAMESCLHWLRIGGIAVWVGGTFPQDSLRISSEEVIRNLITIKGLHNYNISDFVYAVSFIEKVHTQFPFRELVHDAFSLYEVEEAFKYAIKENPFRVGVRID